MWFWIVILIGVHHGSASWWFEAINQDIVWYSGDYRPMKCTLINSNHMLGNLQCRSKSWFYFNPFLVISGVVRGWVFQSIIRDYKCLAYICVIDLLSNAASTFCLLWNAKDQRTEKDSSLCKAANYSKLRSFPSSKCSSPFPKPWSPGPGRSDGVSKHTLQ